MPNTTRSALRTKTRKELKIDRLWKVWDDSEVNEALDEAIEEIQDKWDNNWQENQTEIVFDSIIDQQEYDLDTNVPDYIGIDLVEDYCEYSRDRVNKLYKIDNPDQ